MANAECVFFVDPFRRRQFNGTLYGWAFLEVI